MLQRRCDRGGDLGTVVTDAAATEGHKRVTKVTTAQATHRPERTKPRPAAAAQNSGPREYQHLAPASEERKHQGDVKNYASSQGHAVYHKSVRRLCEDQEHQEAPAEDQHSTAREVRWQVALRFEGAADHLRRRKPVCTTSSAR